MKRDPGNTLKKAQKINFSEFPFSLRNKISAQDRDDLFRLRLRSSYEIDISLSKLKGNADLEFYTLKKQQAKVFRGIGKGDFTTLRKKDIRRNLRRVGRSKKSGKQAEKIQQPIEPGIYFIRVFSKKPISTKYKLQVALSEPLINPSDSVTPSSALSPTPSPTSPPISPPTSSPNSSTSTPPLTTPFPSSTPTSENQFQQRWVQQFGSAQDDQGLAIALDSNNQNVYIGGSTGGSLIDDPVTTIDAFIRKYNSDGIEQWRQIFGSADGDGIDTLTVDPANNIYGTGITDFTRPSGLDFGESNVLLFQYDANGTQIFEQRLEQGSLDSGLGIALDSNNNIYTIGRNFTINLTAFQIDIAPFINAYTSDGQFQRSINPNLNRQGYASRILIDNDNNLYIAGVTNATFSLTDPDNPLIGDAFIAKYDANGQQLWLQTLGSSDADFVAGIALDPSGNIYITGDTQGSLPDNLSQGETDAYLAKFNENGDRLWVKQFGTSSTDNSAGVAIDNAGTIFLAGRTSGSLFGNSPIGQTDGWLAAFNENGEIVTSTYIGTPGEDRINGLVVDASGQIYVTGETAGNLSGPNQGGLDAWIAKYRYGG